MRFQITKCWALSGLLAAAAWAAPQGKLGGVDTRTFANGVQVDIRGENLGKPKEFRVNGGKSYLLEFDATMVGRGARNGVNKAGVEFVHYAWFKANPPTIRVHVRIKPEVEPVLSKTDNGWKVVVGTTAELEKAKNPSKEKPRIATVNTEQKAPGKIEPPFLPYPKDESPVVYATHRPAEAPARVNDDGQTKSVTLDCVNVDVIQILKALSTQAGVNIVASPDVSPVDKPLRLTISLSKVTVDEALSFVTALSKLRFGRVGNTFVVSLSENFAAAMRQIMDRDSEHFTTKVVALKSGEGIQIREAVVKALPPEGRGGWYDLIVPGYTPQGAAPGNGKGGGAPAETGGGAGGVQDMLRDALGGGGQGLPAGTGGPQTKTDEPKASPGTEVLSSGGLRERAFYLMIVGEPKRIEAIAKYVEELDGRIIESFSLAMTTDMGSLVVPINSGRPEQITAMLQRILSSNPRAHEYSFNTTTVKDLQEGEESTHILLVMGPTAEIARLEEMIVTMDNEMCQAAGIAIARTVEERERLYDVINLRYVEPKMAEFDLKSKIRGLQVSVLPDPVTPGLRGKLEDTKLDDPQDPAAKQTKVDEETIKKGVGREPMRLVVRGTRDQIKKAKDYIALVDVPARQVALELRVMDLSKEDALKSGIDWSIFTGGAVKIIRLNNALQGASNTGNASLGGYGAVTAMLDSITNNTNLIARPNTLAIDGMPSTIFIGDVIRYVESITASQNGVTVKTAALEVGVKLTVLPRIGAEGTITMVVNPLVSFLKSFTPVPGGGQLPQTSDRSAMNTLSIKSGETIAIGGLIQHQDTVNVSGIPILKDLPIIGRLFSKTENIRNKKEVVIFLTARVIEGAATSETAPPIDKNMPKTGKGDK